jgi:glycosyltransferase involved in cell wall biosynthesis
MRIIHVSEKINEIAGGTSVYISQLAGATANTGCGPVEIIAFNLPHLGRPVKTPDNISVRLLKPPGLYLYGRSREFSECLKDLAADPAALFHVHNMWRLPLLTACRMARCNGRPCIISPHGALEPYAFSNKALRKKVAWWLVEQRRLSQATVVHATSVKEAENLAALIPGTPIAAVPVGIELQELPEDKPAREHRTALFLSVIVPNKGLLTLLEAWSILRPEGWKLKVAGPDPKGHLAQCQRAVKDYGLEDCVSFAGPAFDDKKWKMYKSADLFVLPTLSENFGIAIAEALACGVPVITTRGAPWKELITHQCGWQIEFGVEPLVQTLREAFELDSELREMGLRGRALIQEKYTWPSIAQKMIEVYEWAAGGGQRPSCILF